MSRIAIDLTPLLPGGENGAAKLLVLELLDQFKQLVPPYNFLLLTAHWNHLELAAFDGPSIERLCVVHKEPSSLEAKSVANPRFLGQVKHRLQYLLPQKAVSRLSPFFVRFVQRGKSQRPGYSMGLLADQKVDLLFCPFTAPIYAEPGIPVVSIFYDLQHRTYPQFFSPQELEMREATLHHLRQHVESVVCISEFSRQALLEDFKIPPERTCTIPVCIHTRLKETIPSPSALETLNLKERPYFFYPANFWPHKNHQMLLTAYNILLERNPNLDLDLVFTGAPSRLEKELRSAVAVMGLNRRVHFFGYRSNDEVAAIFQGCRFLIFPSLYEGFGVPVLEAFAFGKPVLCSQAGSLPQIGGSAAYYFDPRKPLDMVNVMEKVINSPDQMAEKIRHGYEQVSKFNNREMAQEYLRMFGRTLLLSTKPADQLAGGYEDGWLGQDVEISYGAAQVSRVLELILMAPVFLPHFKISIRQKQGPTGKGKWSLARGQNISLRFPLSEAGGKIFLLFFPVFKPSETMNSNDARRLSCLCQSCRIIFPDGAQKVLFPCP